MQQLNAERGETDGQAKDDSGNTELKPLPKAHVYTPTAYTSY